MYVLIEKKSEIAQAQKTLKATVQREFPQVLRKNIGHPGGTVRNARVNGNGLLFYWTAVDPSAKHPKHLNWFGFYNERPGVQSTVEINPPIEGRDNAVNGFFARDADTGVTYLFHTGRVGGGGKGVGKDSFLAYSGYKPKPVLDANNKLRFGVLVMPIEGSDATRSAITYVDKVAEFKAVAKAGEISTPDTREKEAQIAAYRDEFKAEFKGRRTGFHAAHEIDYVSLHATVVDELEAWRSTQGVDDGSVVMNTQLVDLGVKRLEVLTEVYEVKSSTSRQDVYTGIGQLMVHAVDPECRRILVLPGDEKLKNDLKQALLRHDVDLLRYQVVKKQISFEFER